MCRLWFDSYKLTHLLYMDDVKLYASSTEGLAEMLRITEVFSRDIHIEFRMDKCRIAMVGSAAASGDGERFVCKSGDLIVGMEEDETYNYLGFSKLREMEH